MSMLERDYQSWTEGTEPASASQLVHFAFILTSLNMSLWTIYLDYRYFYGWNNGAWMLKFTHWSLLVTIFYLALSTLDMFTLGLALGAPRRWFMYTALVLALMIDLNYFVVLIGRKVLLIDRNLPRISPVSTHKHVLNLIWLLGDAGTNPFYQFNSTEFFVAGVCLPTIICGAYLTLARAIKNKKQGPRVLNYLGIPFDEDWETRSVRMSISSETDTDETIHRVSPGRWIYASFKYRKLRSVFVLQPLAYAPLAYFLLVFAESTLSSRLPLQIFVLGLALTVTPILYGPELWRRHKATLYQAVMQTKRDLVTLLTYLHAIISEKTVGLAEWWEGVRERARERSRRRRERLKKLIPKVEAAVQELMHGAALVISDLARAMYEFLARHAQSIEHFFKFTLPQAAIYSIHASQDIAQMVFHDVKDAAKEMYRMIESVELEENE
eukprot:CAMPEP_0171510148 /NCGR_PEP_ID=MMETSP0959-20130129/200_1 /TAXON_ID=87120 /ORGANISM="Aurantiochytrium limacinum, Strain ATCCMYA-1381" /LENGTH=439 /DNA_ID=CAMNT_0012047475 /DNA_START=689 /DNA_END=2008 /DNA_ORIENTATION=+